MVSITFVQPSGESRVVEAEVGATVMRCALDNGVVGIAAECGGCLSCATCHAYVDPKWMAIVPPPSEEEIVMVECAIDVRPNSRLTCQLLVTDELDGIVIEVPEAQY